MKYLLLLALLLPLSVQAQPILPYYANLAYTPSGDSVKMALFYPDLKDFEVVYMRTNPLRPPLGLVNPDDYIDVENIIIYSFATNLPISIPEPSWLFALGLLALVGVRRCRIT